jgi:hypothetical protein
MTLAGGLLRRKPDDVRQHLGGNNNNPVIIRKNQVALGTLASFCLSGCFS